MNAHSGKASANPAKDGMPKRRMEVVIALAIVAVALAVFFLTRLPTAGASSATSGGPFAVVQNAEGFYQAVPLSQDNSFSVVSSSGENHVSVSGGKVVMNEADCPNQVCVQAGSVSRVGDTIVCLPHKLVVQVVADPSDASPIQGIMG